MQVKRIFYLLLIMTCPIGLAQCRSKTMEDHERYALTKTDSIAAKIELLDTALTSSVDSIWVSKHTRRMYVFNERKLLKVYHISLGSQPIGQKHFQGDRKTPEGLYHIDGKNPNSMAHKNLGISYPNESDRKYARRQGKPTGGDVKIHGMVNGWEAQEADYLDIDWTWGCIAVANKDIDELYQYVSMGAPIWIAP